MNLADIIAERYLTKAGKPRSVRWDENGVPRDQWGRPIIVKSDGTVKGYTRISSLAKDLDDETGLTIWKTAMTLLGTASDEPIGAIADRLDAVSGRSKWGEKVRKLRLPLDLSIRDSARLLVGKSDNPYDDEDIKPKVIALAELAQEAAGSRRKAQLGTELHSWTEWFDRTHDITKVPDEYRRDLDAYMWATSEMEMLDAEVFVVVDEIEAAGTFDRRARMPGGIRIGDIKTGRWDRRYPMAVEMQTAMYAHGDLYDLTTGERRPMECDRDLAWLIHMPSGSGKCDLYELDIERGWRNVLLAMELRAARKEAQRTLRPMVHEVAA